MVRQPLSCLGTSPRPEERNEGIGDWSDGTRNLPNLHSSAITASKVVGVY